ncbi:hypothetical protein ABPG77_005019 [Micractinium sp. CCAP 211/92]
MSIPEAIKGAQAELARIHSPLQRVQRLAVYARIFAAELFGTVLAVPFGIRAFSLHCSLPDARSAGGRAGSVSILRDVRYGSRPRNTLDIYLPPSLELRGSSELLGADSSSPPGSNGRDAAGGATASISSAAAANDLADAASAAAGGAPVVLFCHGGVWASGSKWHYAPLATRLAQAGVITAVMSYSLYPDALIPQMVAEVSRALSWTMDNARRLGGNPQQVSLVGHSAGAHLCTMALLHRALAASKAEAASTGHGGSSPGAIAAQAQPDMHAPAAQSGSPLAGQQQQQQQQLGGAAAGAAVSEAMGEAEEAAAFGDHRMPHKLVAIAGVYDIAKHYEYEEARHVHKLSTMERACGGNDLFPAFSPAVILAHVLGRQQQAAAALQRSWEQICGNPRELLEEAGVAGSGSHERPGRASVGSPVSSPGTSSSVAVNPEEAAQAAAGAGASQQAQQGQQQGGQQGPAGRGGAPAAAPPAVAAGRYYQSFDLAGEAIARRIGFDRVAAAEAAAAGPPPSPAAAGGAARSSAAAARAVPAAAPAAAAAEGRGPWRIFGLTADAVRKLPPTVLTSSCTDLTVPWFESAEMYWMLHDCGIPAKHLVYNKVGHVEFVTEWAALPRISGTAAGDEADLPPHAADLVKVVSGRARVAYSRAE